MAHTVVLKVNNAPARALKSGVNSENSDHSVTLNPTKQIQNTRHSIMKGGHKAAPENDGIRQHIRGSTF
jgi:hypothetical protein